MFSRLKNACFNRENIKGRSLSRSVVFLFLVVAILPVLFFGIKKLIVRASDPVTYTVCTTGCNFTTVTGAFASSTVASGDTIEVRTGYSSGTTEVGIRPEDGVGGRSSITLQCENDGVVIGNSTTLSNLFGGYVFENFRIQNCSLVNMYLPLATSSVAINNTFTRTELVDGAFLDIKGGGVEISNNIFVDRAFLQSWPIVLASSGFDDLLISGNTFSEGGALQKTAYSAIRLWGGTTGGVIENNYFVQTVSDLLGSANAVINVVGTSTEAVNLIITHNTFKTVTSTTAISIADSELGESGLSTNVNVTSTYNIFYNAGISGNNSREGIYYNPSYNENSVLNIFEDYNSFSNYSTNISVHGGPGLVVSGGHSLDDVNPFFKIGDVDSTNDLHLAPFSPLLDVDGVGGDIGAYSGERISNIYLDDNGLVTYSYGVGTATVSTTINNIIYSYGGFAYDDSVGVGIPGIGDGYTLITDFTATPTAYISDGLDITQFVQSHPSNWNLALAIYGDGGPKLTIFVPDDVASNTTTFESGLCQGETCLGGIKWVDDVFVYSGGVYTYNAEAIALAGVSLYTTNTPAITNITSYGPSNVHMTSTADLSFLRDGDVLHLAAGVYAPLDIVSNASGNFTGSVEVVGSGTGTIIRSNGNDDVVFLRSVDGVNIHDLKMENASTTANKYFLSNAVFDFNGFTYVNGGDLNSGRTLFLAGNSCSDFVFFGDSDYDVTTAVGDATNNWHLAFGSIMQGGEIEIYPNVAILIPNNFFSDEESFANAVSTCGESFSWVRAVGGWVTSTFSVSGGEFSLNTSALADAGVSVTPGYMAEIEHVTAYAGIKLVDSDNNLISSTTISNNGYGVLFKGTSNNNSINYSTISNSLFYDLYSRGNDDNYFRNVNFSRVSSSVENVGGSVTVQFLAQASVVNSSSIPIAGVSVSFSGTNTSTTGVGGRTPLGTWFSAYRLTSNSIELNSGGYNPYTISAAASSTYLATSTVSYLESVSQVFNLVMLENSEEYFDVEELPSVVSLSTTTLNLSEASGSTNYTVRLLNDVPEQIVRVTPTSTGSKVVISPEFLTFDLDNWQTPQTFTVTAIDNYIDEDDISDIITHTVSSSDSAYNNLSVSSSLVQIVDNDTAGFTVTESSGSTVVTEGGGTDSYSVVLGSSPTSTVTINIVTSGKVTTLPSSLSFTSTTWNTLQTVTVTAVDDANVEGAHSDTITQTATSLDGHYSGISVASVSVSISDNDVVVVTSGGGGGAVYVQPPKVPADGAFLINNGEKTTSDPHITLLIRAENAIQMAVSHDPSFENVGYEPYSSEKSWTLTEGDGEKNVFIKLRSAQGGEVVAVQSIKLLTKKDLAGSVGGVIVSSSLPIGGAGVSANVGEALQIMLKKLNRLLSFGSIGEDVSALQTILREYKYFFFSRITKYFGPITQGALKNYQKDNQLVPTGNLDIATREKLKGEKENVVLKVPKYNFTEYLTLGSYGEGVRALQTILKDLGYFDYSQVSGMYGPITQAAVVKFQKDHGITPATGSVGPKTREFLNGLE